MTESLSTIRAMKKHLDRAYGILAAYELWPQVAALGERLEQQRKWHGLDFGQDPAEREGEPT